jgi:ABC-type Mn2+/Zn2+ transport system permease subunit
MTSVYYIALYLICLSIQYLLLGLYPRLDGHLSASLFGDVVTIDTFESILMLAIFTLFAFTYRTRKTEIYRKSFEYQTFGHSTSSSFSSIIMDLLIIFSLYGLGLLFILSFLIIPNLLLGPVFKSEKQAVRYTLFVCLTSALLGLFISIVAVNISTTAMQILLLAFLCIITRQCFPRLQ